MTDLEKLEQAKTYIDALANGIHPITQQPTAETEAINHVAVSRCLFFVSQVLAEQVARQKNPPALSSFQKRPFQLDFDVRSQYRLSTTPISISEITRRLNQLVNTSEMKSLTHQTITEWLVLKGFLTTVTESDGSHKRVPTDDGNQIGITLEYRYGANGMYSVTVYNLEAQQFILDNLDDALETKRQTRAKKEANQWEPWTEDQDNTLTELYQNNAPISQIAHLLRRSRGGIKARIHRLGLDER
jgi:hypothetical protein